MTVVSVCFLNHSRIGCIFYKSIRLRWLLLFRLILRSIVIELKASVESNKIRDLPDGRLLVCAAFVAISFVRS